MARMGATIGDRCVLITGASLPLVDELLSADYSFCVVFDCLDLDQKYEMNLHSFVQRKIVKGIEFMFTQRANCQTRWVTDELDELVDTFEMQRMEKESLKIRSKLPTPMCDLLDHILLTKGLFTQICQLAQEVLPGSFKTLFILDTESSASIHIPEGYIGAATATADLEIYREGESCEDVLSIVRDQLKNKLTPKSIMMTHITVANANSFCICAYNDIFLEEAQKCGILLKSAPNEWCCRYSLLFPAVRAWERQMMHPLIPTSILFNTELNECIVCKDVQSIAACKSCGWARLCTKCTHDSEQCEVMQTYKDAIDTSSA
jgi:hypothetical protein